MYHYFPLPIKNGEGDGERESRSRRFCTLPSFTRRFSCYLPTKPGKRHWQRASIWRGQKWNRATDCPACLTLFNEAPAVRHKGLNPPLSNIAAQWNTPTLVWTSATRQGSKKNKKKNKKNTDQNNKLSSLIHVGPPLRRSSPTLINI